MDDNLCHRETMDYEEKTIDGVTMIAFKGCWYLLPPEPEEPPYDEAMAKFPFYDLTNYDMQDLFDYDINDKPWPCPLPERCPNWLEEDWLRFNP